MNLIQAPEAADAYDENYVISAQVSLQERRPRTLKHGDTFGVFDRNGDVVAGEGFVEGVYHRDTRYLSRFELVFAGARPILLSSGTRDDNAMLTCDLTNPALHENGVDLEHDLIHIRRSKFLWNGACYERFAVRNFSDRDLRLTLQIRFAADFADLFEVRGSHRPRRGSPHAADLTADSVKLAYTGLDDRRRTTALRFEPTPDRLDARQATFTLSLPAAGRCVLFAEIRCDQEVASERLSEVYLTAMLQARRALRRSAARAASVATSNDIFNEAARRSVSDLYMLVTDTAQGPYPYAGIPWFSTAFGRDALITALQTLWMDPAIARGVLFYLAAHQATRVDPVADAEPGKILHEVRHGEMAELGEVPFRHYYGSVDATPLFVMLAGAYLARTGDVAVLRRLWRHVDAALGWIDDYGDRDGDGFVEYFRMTDKGLANQGWKDSHDSVFHADGSFAEGPIALCEVQAYVYGAKRAAAAIAAALDMPERAAALTGQAETLRQRIEQAFWSDELGTYALALDGAKRPCLVRSSNAGHLLLTELAAPERARQVAAELMSSNSFSGWGVRTLASTERRYNPMSYHNGSVWPHDNALIGMGFARYGLREEAARIFEGLFGACTYIDLRRLPELVCGFPRRRSQGPTFYPVACAPQAWSAATPLSLVQSCLGLGFDPASSTVFFDRPILPRFLEEVVLRGLSIGTNRIDVALRGRGRDVAMTVLARSGEIRATMTS
ncbi:MAG TPA: amylo-alpha-1,6-glucosidase [Acetobacteraceae bacterium]|nr:amylo-alpha-1,6-glucosidase [Acetobacteraceae bacterium]